MFLGPGFIEILIWKVHKVIPYGAQNISEADILAVNKVLRSDFLTQGPVVPKFEEELCRITTAKFATAVNSATSALHLACLALGVKKGDLVWTVPNTFVASANCALYCGANIDFVDIDQKTSNISINKLEEKLQFAARSGNLPKVLVPVHLTGEPCEMSKIRRLGNKFNFKIIEDASHAIGGKYQNNPIGSCEFSDITIFSFHPVKIITSGEGGATLTNDEEIDRKIKLLRSHGITRDQNLMEYPSKDPWYYEQIDLGFNYRMTDIHAALGLSQLECLNDFVKKRHFIAEVYDNMFANSNLKLPFRAIENLSAMHLYVIQVKSERHKEIFHSLRRKSIGVNLHYIPVHTHPYYQRLGFEWGDFPNSELYYRKAISLPMYTKLDSKQQNFVIDTVRTLCDG